MPETAVGHCQKHCLGCSAPSGTDFGSEKCQIKHNYIFSLSGTVSVTIGEREWMDWEGCR